MNADLSKRQFQAKPSEEKNSSGSGGVRPRSRPDWSLQREEGLPPVMEVLISLSNTVADSKDIDLSGHRLSFAVDEDTGDRVINIVDNGTGEITRQVPPDEILKLKGWKKTGVPVR